MPAGGTGDTPTSVSLTVRGVVFDLDGTLIDSLTEIATNANASLQAFGQPTHAVDAYRAFVGDGIGVLARRVAPDLPEHDMPQFLADLGQRYHANFGKYTTIFPGVHDTLEALRRRSVPLALLSNKPHDLAVRTIEQFFDPEAFSFLLGNKPDIPRKPDPAGLLLACAALKLPPAEVAMVGDSDVDIYTANAAGCVPIGVSWGFRSVDELIAAGSAHVIDKPMELLRLVGAVVTFKAKR